MRLLSCAACGREFAVRNRVKYCSEQCRLEAMSEKAVKAYRAQTEGTQGRENEKSRSQGASAA